MSGEAKTEKKRSSRRAGTRVKIGGAGKGVHTRLNYGPARRLPKTALGGLIGVIGVVLFFAGLTGDAWPRFLGMIGLAVALLVLSIWALILSPIRPHVPQRWRPRRRIEPLDLTAWRAVAEETGLRLRAKRGLPLIRGGFRGVALRLAYHQIGGARTVATGALVHPFRARLDIRPRRAEFGTADDRATGDEEFDREFRCECADVDPVERFLDPEVREWIRVLEPETVVVAGRAVEVTSMGYVIDPDVLRGLLELVVALARR